MATFHVSIPHTLSQKDAIARIQQLVTDTKATYKDLVTKTTERWSGNKGTFSLTAQGFTVDGTVMVHPKTVEITGDLPLMLSFMKAKIESTITKHATTLLHS